MAAETAALKIALLIWTGFCVKKAFFVSCDSVCYSSFPKDVQDVQDNFIYSSLWQFSQEKGQNIRGLYANFGKILTFLQSYRKTHFLSLSETHLDNTTPNELFKIPGYNFVRKNRKNGKHGGVGAFVHESIPYIRREDLESEKLECLW